MYVCAMMLYHYWLFSEINFAENPLSICLFPLLSSFFSFAYYFSLSLYSIRHGSKSVHDFIRNEWNFFYPDAQYTGLSLYWTPL